MTKERPEIQFLKGEASQVSNIGNKLILKKHFAGDIEEVRQSVLTGHIWLASPRVKIPYGRQ